MICPTTARSSCCAEREPPQGRARAPARDRAPRCGCSRPREHACLARGGNRRPGRRRRVRHLARPSPGTLARRTARGRALARRGARVPRRPRHRAAPRREAPRATRTQSSTAVRRHRLEDRAYLSTAFALTARRFAARAPGSTIAIGYPRDRVGISKLRWPQALTRAGAAALRQVMPVRVPVLLRWARANAVSLHHTLCSRAAVVGRAPPGRPRARLDGERPGHRASASSPRESTASPPTTPEWWWKPWLHCLRSEASARSGPLRARLRGSGCVLRRRDRRRHHLDHLVDGGDDDCRNDDHRRHDHR